MPFPPCPTLCFTTEGNSNSKENFFFFASHSTEDVNCGKKASSFLLSCLSHNAWPFPLVSSVASFPREQQPESRGHGSHRGCPEPAATLSSHSPGICCSEPQAARWAPDGPGTARHRLCPSTEQMGTLWNGAQASSSRALSRAQLVACERLRFQSPGSELNIKLKISLERKFPPTISISSKYNF